MALAKALKTCDVNLRPLLDTILEGVPWNQKTWYTSRLAVSSAAGSFGRARTYAALQNWSTTVTMTLFPLDGGRPVTMSRATWDQGLPGTGRGCRSPAADWCCALPWAQTSQAATNSCVSLSSVGHQKKRNRKVIVRLAPAPRPRNWPKRSSVCSRHCPLLSTAVGTLLQICLSPWH